MSEKSTNFVPRKNIRMRKYICIIGLLVSCCLSTVADEVLTATLQHNGQMTPYFGKDAFREAKADAVDGDTITLSPGRFEATLSVRNRIRVVGTAAFDWGRLSREKVTYFSGPFQLLADSIELEGCQFSDPQLFRKKNITIKRCELLDLHSQPHENTLVDQCLIWNENAIDNGINYTIRNSTIWKFEVMNTPTNVANITHCFVWDYYLADSSHGVQPYAIYTDNVLCLDATTQDAPEYQVTGVSECIFYPPSEFHYNHFYRMNSDHDANYFVPYSFAPGCVNDNNTVNSENSSSIYGYGGMNDQRFEREYPCTYAPTIGSDGTPVGITGGVGFNLYPGIPRILSSSFDEKTDLQGQWHASFTVTAEKEKLEDNPSVVVFEYWVDDPYDNGNKQTMTVTGSSFNPTFDFSALVAGSHTLYYRFQDDLGAYSALYVQSFERKNPYDEVLLLPYDATTLDEEQQTANPTYMAYPTEIETQMPTIQCDDTN